MSFSRNFIALGLKAQCWKALEKAEDMVAYFFKCGQMNEMSVEYVELCILRAKANTRFGEGEDLRKLRGKVEMFFKGNSLRVNLRVAEQYAELVGLVGRREELGLVIPNLDETNQMVYLQREMLRLGKRVGKEAGRLYGLSSVMRFGDDVVLDLLGELQKVFFKER